MANKYEWYIFGSTPKSSTRTLLGKELQEEHQAMPPISAKIISHFYRHGRE